MQRTPLSITPSNLETAGIFEIRDNDIWINMLRLVSGELPKNEFLVLNIERRDLSLNN